MSPAFHQLKLVANGESAKRRLRRSSARCAVLLPCSSQETAEERLGEHPPKRESCISAAPYPDSDDTAAVENATDAVSIGWDSTIIGVPSGTRGPRDPANASCDSVAPIDEQSGPPARARL